MRPINNFGNVYLFFNYYFFITMSLFETLSLGSKQLDLYKICHCNLQILSKHFLQSSIW